MRLPLKLLLTLVLTTSAAHAESFDHAPWTRLLARHVTAVGTGYATVVDYDGMASDRAALMRYLEALSDVDRDTFDGWPKADRLAFLINAYNAWTVELILTRWPEIESIKDLGGFLSSPWDKRFIPLLGATRTLDDIEHKLIRQSGQFEEPRIHFAVNCASIGCPALRAEAYLASRIDEQLEEQTDLFLSDRTRNRLSDDSLELSSIFRWYREDFERGWLGYRNVRQFLADHADALGLTPRLTERLQSGELAIDHLPYDWRLNAKQ